MGLIRTNLGWKSYTAMYIGIEFSLFKILWIFLTVTYFGNLRTGHNSRPSLIAISRQQALDKGRQIAMLFDVFVQNCLGCGLIDQTP